MRDCVESLPCIVLGSMDWQDSWPVSAHRASLNLKFIEGVSKHFKYSSINLFILSNAEMVSSNQTNIN